MNKNETKFYVVVNNQQKGPFSIDELKLIEINRDTLVWSQEMTDWSKAEDINGLSFLFLKTPPQIPNITPAIEITLKKEKSPEEILKSSNSKKIFASEIINIFKSIGYSICIAIIFYGIYYSVMVPPKVSDENIKIATEELAKIEMKANKYGAISYAIGSIYTYIGFSKYDSGVISSYSLSSINEDRYNNFENDVNEKTLFCFIISLLVLIVGRYAYKAINWTYENGTK